MWQRQPACSLEGLPDPVADSPAGHHQLVCGSAYPPTDTRADLAVGGTLDAKGDSVAEGSAEEVSAEAGLVAHRRLDAGGDPGLGQGAGGEARSLRCAVDCLFGEADSSSGTLDCALRSTTNTTSEGVDAEIDADGSDPVELFVAQGFVGQIVDGDIAGGVERSNGEIDDEPGEAAIGISEDNGVGPGGAETIEGAGIVWLSGDRIGGKKASMAGRIETMTGVEPA